MSTGNQTRVEASQHDRGEITQLTPYDGDTFKWILWISIMGDRARLTRV